MGKRFILTGTLLAGLSVALGAFGAHGLKQIVPPETVTTFQTGVQYQFSHALALILLGLLMKSYSHRWLGWAGNMFIAGIICFSGSLYVLTLLRATDQTGLSGIGIVTPVGGLLFILAWLLLLLGIWRARA